MFQRLGAKGGIESRLGSHFSIQARLGKVVKVGSVKGKRNERKVSSPSTSRRIVEYSKILPQHDGIVE